MHRTRCEELRHPAYLLTRAAHYWEIALSLIGQAELPSAALVGATRCPQHACVKPADLGSPGTRATRSFRRRSCRLDCRDPIAQPIPSAVHSAVHTHRTVATLLLPIRASVRVRRCVCASPCIECDMSGHARMCTSTRACVHSCSCAHGATAQRPNGSQGYSAVLLSGTTSTRPDDTLQHLGRRLGVRRQQYRVPASAAHARTLAGPIDRDCAIANHFGIGTFLHK